jgi:hypothetical protein
MMLGFVSSRRGEELLLLDGACNTGHNTSGLGVVQMEDVAHNMLATWLLNIILML